MKVHRKSETNVVTKKVKYMKRYSFGVLGLAPGAFGSRRDHEQPTSTSDQKIEIRGDLRYDTVNRKRAGIHEAL